MRERDLENLGPECFQLFYRSRDCGFHRRIEAFNDVLFWQPNSNSFQIATKILCVILYRRVERSGITRVVPCNRIHEQGGIVYSFR